MRLIDADKLTEEVKGLFCPDGFKLEMIRTINNAPTIEPEITNDDLQAAMTESWHLGYELAETKFKRPQGECKTCKHYCPYHKMFSTETRGDGFCTIARLTSEGFLNINCNDDFYCSYYTKGNEE